MTKRFTLIILAFALVLAVVFTGCAPARRPFDNGAQYNTNGNQNGNNVGFNTNYRNNSGDLQGRDMYRTGSGMYGTGADMGQSSMYRTGTDLGYGSANNGRIGTGTNGRNDTSLVQWDNNVAQNPDAYDGLFGSRLNGNYGQYNNNMGNAGNARTINQSTANADGIEAACEKIQGVENATVVLTGNTAYVGIDLDNNMANPNQNNIRTQVSQMVRSMGNDINTVYVSTDADFKNRLRNVGDGMRTGRPMNTFTTELNQMVESLTPARW